MRRLANQEEEKALWLSEDNDWNTPEGNVIAVWDGCIIKEEEYKDFQNFINEEVSSEVEPVGSFDTAEGTAMFVFIVKSNVPQFSIWRFKLPGMRWWFDAFWETNGGRVAKDSEILPIINKLGLTVSGATQYVHDEN
jgi:hypothetical protein